MQLSHLTLSAVAGAWLAATHAYAAPAADSVRCADVSRFVGQFKGDCAIVNTCMSVLTYVKYDPSLVKADFNATLGEWMAAHNPYVAGTDGSQANQGVADMYFLLSQELNIDVVLTSAVPTSAPGYLAALAAANLKPENGWYVWVMNNTAPTPTTESADGSETAVDGEDEPYSNPEKVAFFRLDLCADLIGCGLLDPTGAFGTCQAGADPACSDEYIGDGICDEACNQPAFGMDGGAEGGDCSPGGSTE